LSFSIAGRHGPTLALSAGAVFAGAASVASGLRLFAPSHRVSGASMRQPDSQSRELTSK
jgi:DHA2 family multidrug resistance protein-like MFS transporter